MTKQLRIEYLSALLNIRREGCPYPNYCIHEYCCGLCSNFQVCIKTLLKELEQEILKKGKNIK